MCETSSGTALLTRKSVKAEPISLRASLLNSVFATLPTNHATSRRCAPCAPRGHHRELSDLHGIVILDTVVTNQGASMTPTPGHPVPVITSIQQWRQDVKESPLSGEPRIFLGELVKPVLPRQPAQILVPWYSHDQPGGFTAITACLQSTPPAAQDSHAVGRQVRVIGSPQLDLDGGISLRAATLTMSDQRGAFLAWQDRQVQLLDNWKLPRRGATDLASVEQEVTDHLRANPGKKVVWLGRDTSEAFRDATGGSRGSDQKLVDLLDARGLALKGVKAKGALLDELHHVGQDTALVIISRGGGDPGELSLFDDAELLRAIHECPAKTLTALGHTQQTFLADQVAAWSLAVPKQVATVLRPFAHGSTTMKERDAKDRSRVTQQRAVTAEREQERARLAQERVRLERERDEALRRVSSAEARSTRLDQQVRDSQWRFQQTIARERQQKIIALEAMAKHWIGHTQRLIGVMVALLGLCVALGLLSWAPSAWRVSAATMRDVALAIVFVSSATILWAERLGGRPFFRQPKPVDADAGYQKARSIRSFNRVSQSHHGLTPRWGRARKSEQSPFGG